MMVAPLIGLVALVVILSFFVLWGVAFVKLFRRQPLLAYEPRRPVPWGLVDLGLVVIILFLAALASSHLLKGQFGPGAGTEKQPFTLQQNMLIILADAGMKVAVMLIVTPIIMLRTGCTWRDLGIVPRQAGRDICIGLAAFCMLAPIVFAIQGLLTQLEPYKHPLIEMMTNTPDMQLFALLCFSAAILAPLSEEWAFRVLLQGWLEKLVTYSGSSLHILFGGLEPAEPMVLENGNSPAPPEGITFLLPVPQQTEIQWIDPTNPYAPPPTTTQPLASAYYDQPLAAAIVPEYSPPPVWKHWLPICFSSIIFALMHLSHGLAWIPLTLLAFGLGYIYQRTHRILPSITVHFCLNALSMAAFWVQMFEAPQLRQLQGK
jgi:membrane protease YdiL (CAAX protease family)